MKNIENKIKEIRDYFINKMINNDYEVIISDDYILWIRIDDTYDFVLWISNGVDCLRVTYTLDDGSNEVLSFMDIKFSTEEQHKIWCTRMDSIQKAKQEKVDRIEKEQYERLKAKFEK